LVYELIRNDVLLFNEQEKMEFATTLLNYDNPNMKHAITSLISVISSTLKGVEYLTTRNNMVNNYNLRLLLKKLYK